MTRKISLVLAGGVALGAYQGGAYAVLHERRELWPEHISASSIGAINAALIAGSPPEQRVERLRAFWEMLTRETAALPPSWLGQEASASWRRAQDWFGVLQTRLLGQSGAFYPRTAEMMIREVTSLYDLSPLRANLIRFIDFDRLNGGEIRLSVTTSDVATGDAVVFDTAHGDRLSPDHLLATCGFLPDFPPVEIGGRLLGDGAFVGNAPLDPVLAGAQASRDHLCLLVDLFRPDGDRPTNLEEAGGRQWDLLLGNQTRLKLEQIARDHRMRWRLGRLAGRIGDDLRQDPDLASFLGEGVEGRLTILALAYRPRFPEAGPQKPFEFSRASLDDRWNAGALDMAEAVRIAETAPEPADGVVIRPIRR